MGAIDNIRVADLTVGQLSELIRGLVAEARSAEAEEPKRAEAPEERYVYGITGIATLLGISRTYAQRIKSEGVLDGAIMQRGRAIVCNAERALQLFNERN